MIFAFRVRVSENLLMGDVDHLAKHVSRHYGFVKIESYAVNEA